jgi:hypothetical protein
MILTSAVFGVTVAALLDAVRVWRGGHTRAAFSILRHGASLAGRWLVTLGKQSSVVLGEHFTSPSGGVWAESYRLRESARLDPPTERLSIFDPALRLEVFEAIIRGHVRPLRCK